MNLLTHKYKCQSFVRICFTWEKPAPALVLPLSVSQVISPDRQSLVLHPRHFCGGSWETANASFHEGSMKQIYHNTTNVYLLHFVHHFALQHFSSPVERYFSPTWHFFFFTHTHDTYVISQIRSHKNMKTLTIISLLLSQFCSSMSDHLPCSRISALTSTWCRNLSWIVCLHLIHYFRKL